MDEGEKERGEEGETEKEEKFNISIVELGGRSEGTGGGDDGW